MKKELASDFMQAVNAVIAEALEEAARIADDVSDNPPPNILRHPDWQMGWLDGAMEVAAAIRARVKPE